jgi:hypothetical protein
VRDRRTPRRGVAEMAGSSPAMTGLFGFIRRIVMPGLDPGIQLLGNTRPPHRSRET